jgi:hypothetical protein
MIVDRVSDWAVQTIRDIVKALGDRPFGLSQKSPEQQLQEDYLPIRDDATAIFQKLMSDGQQIISELQSKGVPPDRIWSVSPYNIAANRWLNFMTEMEDLLRRKHAEASGIASTLPEVPQPQVAPPEGYKFSTPTIPAPVSLEG